MYLIIKTRWKRNSNLLPVADIGAKVWPDSSLVRRRNSEEPRRRKGKKETEGKQGFHE